MDLISFVRSEINKEDVVLDIGCGDKVISKQLRCKRLVTIDAWAKVNPDMLLDLETNDLPFEDGGVDVILMLDFIEHLTKERGQEILKQAKRVARKKIILLTPLWWQDNSINVLNPNMWCYGNQYDYHKSLWTLEDFVGWVRALGINDKYFIGVWNK